MDPHTLIDWIKDRKTWWMETQPRGDMPPIVLAQKDDQLVIVTSPVEDKRHGLIAARILMTAINPDIVIFIGDAHVDIAKSEEEFYERYPRGMQHACDEEDKCATTTLSDCMLAQVMCDDRSDTIVVPYDYVNHHTKREVVWKDDQIRLPISYEESGGQIVEDMRESMLRSPEVEMLFRMMAMRLGLDPNSPKFEHTLHQSALEYLADQGYIVEDDLEYRRTIFMPSGSNRRWHKQEHSMN